MEYVQVFIPTYNRREFLEKAIDSVFSQTYPFVEIVVLDNASSDDSQAYMEGLISRDDRIKYHRNSENIGMTGNFNLIGPMVSRPFFCVLTDDDVYESHFLQTAIDLFQQYPSSGFVGTNAPILKDGKIIDVMIEDWPEGFHYKGTRVSECSRSRHPLITHCIFRESLAPDFVFHDSIRMVADGHLLTCLATKYDMAVSKTVTGYWNIHGSNATATQEKDLEKYITVLVSRIKLYDEFCRKNGLKNKLQGFYEIRLLIGLLQTGRDAACFQKMINRKDVRVIFNQVTILIIRLLNIINFLDIALLAKGLLRKRGAL